MQNLSQLQHEIEHTTRELLIALKCLESTCIAEAKHITKSGFVNSCGIVQGQGGRIDALCGKLAALKGCLEE